jgi:hypothetical protein
VNQSINDFVRKGDGLSAGLLCCGITCDEHESEFRSVSLANYMVVIKGRARMTRLMLNGGLPGDTLIQSETKIKVKFKWK